MPRLPPGSPRCIAFLDGQNLFHAAKNAFGYRHPNYDVARLAAEVSRRQGWELIETRFYTGVPDASDKPFWNAFWTWKLAAMGRQGVHVYSRSLRYRNQTVRLPDGSSHSFLVGQEKGIDIRIALDATTAILEERCDVLLLFSQDQDLSEVADDVRRISVQQDRWIKIASAYPVSPTHRNSRGVNGTDWIRIERSLYDACIDPRDYRPRA